MEDLFKYYSRKDIQKELIKISKSREISVMYKDKFGKRPDVLEYENDILEMVKKGATSFHASEERWSNPLLLKPGMTKKQLDDLRIGFDCILDLDSKFVDFSKFAAKLIVDGLRFNNLKNVFVKFSGNKGFHIGIPFESFPKVINGIDITLSFPDIIRNISSYLKNIKEIEDNLAQEILTISPLKDICKAYDKGEDYFLKRICERCKTNANKIKIFIYACKMCKGQQIQSRAKESTLCPTCMTIMDLIKEEEYYECPRCRNTTDFEKGKFDPFAVVDIDSILISSRHMFRMPYSYHEKSNLVSIPINPNEIKNFKISQAKMKNINTDIPFLDSSKIESPEATDLLQQAIAFNTELPKKEAKTAPNKFNKEFSSCTFAVQEEFFPPCIQKMLKGVKEDGRKRAVFILINFLKSVGWNIDKIQTLLAEWNKKNYEPLREGYILAQISWHKKQNQNILPPNCDNEMYYKGMATCTPDNRCKLIKNPVNYTNRKLSVLKGNKENQVKSKKP